MVLLFIATATSSWYPATFAEEFLDDTAKKLNHRIKLSWSCHNIQDTPEQQPLLFPLPEDAQDTQVRWKRE